MITNIAPLINLLFTVFFYSVSTFLRAYTLMTILFLLTLSSPVMPYGIMLFMFLICMPFAHWLQ